MLISVPLHLTNFQRAQIATDKLFNLINSRGYKLGYSESQEWEEFKREYINKLTPSELIRLVNELKK